MTRSRANRRLRRRQKHFRRRLAVYVGSALFAADVSQAGPQGESVVRGDVRFTRDGALTQIEAGHNSIIEYQGFDIGREETVRFLQPSDAARVLNRVVGLDPTQIDGHLAANGHVYIVNPAGVFFGGEAVVDVAGLVAAAGNLSNDDFLAGVDRFTQLSGPVENFGDIQADLVGLIGKSVANRGSIRAEDGVIAMVAGDSVVFGNLGNHLQVKVETSAVPVSQDGLGVENTGSLEAEGGFINLAAGDLYSLAIRQTGDIRAETIALDGGGTIEVSGSLDVSNATGIGGSIVVTGDEVSVDSAGIDASGTNGGGDIRIGGDLRGEGPTRNARSTRIADTTVDASATESGDGGTVVVWGTEMAEVGGTLSARGGALSGDGGFIETSSAGEIDFSQLRTDASASNGDPGEWLIDPPGIDIDVAAAEAVSAALNDGTDVTIEADDINQLPGAKITQSEAVPTTLRFNAPGDPGSESGFVVLGGGIEGPLPEGFEGPRFLDVEISAEGSVFIDEPISGIRSYSSSGTNYTDFAEVSTSDTTLEHTGTVSAIANTGEFTSTGGGDFTGDLIVGRDGTNITHGGVVRIDRLEANLTNFGGDNSGQVDIVGSSVLVAAGTEAPGSESGEGLLPTIHYLDEDVNIRATGVEGVISLGPDSISNAARLEGQRDGSGSLFLTSDSGRITTQGSSVLPAVALAGGDIEIGDNEGGGLFISGAGLLATAGGEARAFSSGDVTVSAPIEASSDLSVDSTAGNVSVFADLTSTEGNIDVSAVGDASVGSFATLASDETITLTGNTISIARPGPEEPGAFLVAASDSDSSPGAFFINQGEAVLVSDDLPLASQFGGGTAGLDYSIISRLGSVQIDGVDECLLLRPHGLERGSAKSTSCPT